METKRRAFKKVELDSINKMRHELGLPLITQGTIHCIRCNAPFSSCDILRVRFCPKCKYQIEEDEEDAPGE